MSVYDCFTFYNELVPLEIRLHELDPLVDQFVVVEATTTFSGEPKPLYFARHRDRFAPFLDRIRHVVVEDMPAVTDGNRWPLEIHQRRCIVRGLTGSVDDDIVIISDADEIPSRAALAPVLKRMRRRDRVADLREILASAIPVYGAQSDRSTTEANCGVPLSVRVLLRLRTRVEPSHRICRFVHRHFEYFLNGYVHDHIPGAAVMRNATLRRVCSMDCHFPRTLWTGRRFTQSRGGWHFSYLGGAEAIVQKVRAFAHSEFDQPRFCDPISIQARMAEGRNLFDKDGPSHNVTYLPIDDSWPEHVVANQAKYAAFICNDCADQHPVHVDLGAVGEGEQ